MRTNASTKQSLALIFIGVFLLVLVTQSTNVASAYFMASIDWETYPPTPRVGELVTFDTTRSNKWANETYGPLFYGYTWDFGDGSVTNGAVVSHTYASPGNYTIKMKTNDDKENSTTAERTLIVNERTPLMVYTSVSSDRIFIGQDAIIRGNLTDDLTGEGVSGETLQLAWSTGWLETWHEIDSVITNSQGEFTVTWRPPENNKYQIRATWTGNTTYPQTCSNVILSTTPLGDLITGFSSNSTIANMNFNLTTQMLTFTASGPDGTIGYVNITLKKEPSFDPQNIIVLMDNQSIPYSISSPDNNTWLLEINYSHSTHNVLVSLNGNSVIPEFPSVTIVPLIVFLATLAFILLKKHLTIASQKGAIHRLSL